MECKKIEKSGNTDSRVYCSTMMPMTARSFFLTVCRDRKGRYYGTISEIFYENDMAFYGLDDAILKIDQMLDKLGCVQASTELRNFNKKTKQSKSQMPMNERIQLEMKQKMHIQYRDIEELKEHAKTHGNFFIIDIMYRQNSSWQGSITWNKKAEKIHKSQKVHFRSVLEMLKLIDSSFI